MERPTSIDPSKFLVGTLPLKVLWNTGQVCLVYYRITSDRKVKHAAKTELSFANSQLDLLKEELEGINSTLDVYQFDRYVCVVKRGFSGRGRRFRTIYGLTLNSH